jgi:hypothetical protein
LLNVIICSQFGELVIEGKNRMEISISLLNLRVYATRRQGWIDKEENQIIDPRRERSELYSWVFCCSVGSIP